jgi:hypothetical protein
MLWLCAAAVCAGAVLGCASAKWTGEHRAQYRMPQRFYLTVDATDEMRKSDRTGAVAELAGALHHDIWRRGYDAALVSPVEGRDRYPRIEVLVRQWRPASDEIDWFGGVGHAEIDADCAVRMSPDTGPVFEGRIRGRLDLVDYALSATPAPDAAAGAIAGEVLGSTVWERAVPLPYVPPTSRPATAAATATATVLAAKPPPAPSASALAAPPPVAVPPPAAPAPSAPPSAAPAVPTQSFPVE